MTKETHYYIANADGKLFSKFNSDGSPLYTASAKRALHFYNEEHARSYMSVNLLSFGAHYISTVEKELPLTGLEKIYFNDKLNQLDKVYSMACYLYNKRELQSQLYYAIKKLYKENIEDKDD